MGKIITSESRVGYGDKPRSSDNRSGGIRQPGSATSNGQTNAEVPVKSTENQAQESSSPAKPATRTK